MTNISEMTNAEINGALAIEVMGWRKKFFIDCDWWYEDEVRPLITTEFGWQPCTDLNQAVECAEILANLGFNWSVDNIENDHYHASVYRPSTEHIYFCDANIPARALSEAVLMAVRGEG